MKIHALINYAFLAFASQSLLHAEPEPVKESALNPAAVPTTQIQEEKTPDPGKPEEKPLYEWREFAITKLRELQFDTWDGSISFRIGDETYTFRPRTDDKTSAPTEVTAGAAVLTQLRLARKVRIPVLVTSDAPREHVISRWILVFANPK